MKPIKKFTVYKRIRQWVWKPNGVHKVADVGNGKEDITNRVVMSGEGKFFEKTTNPAYSTVILKPLDEEDIIVEINEPAWLKQEDEK